MDRTFKPFRPTRPVTPADLERLAKIFDESLTAVQALVDAIASCPPDRLGELQALARAHAETLATVRARWRAALAPER